MKQNKKGFTLIELLAVIVILAIIALIATPIILNMINDAKKSAAKDSAYGYMKSVENYVALASMGTDISTQYDASKLPANYQTSATATCTKSGDTTTCDNFLTAVNATVKGSKPSEATVTFTNGTVSGATLVIDGYTVVIDAQGNATVS